MTDPANEQYSSPLPAVIALLSVIASSYVILRTASSVSPIALAETSYFSLANSGVVLDAAVTMAIALTIAGCWTFVGVAATRGNSVGRVTPAFAILLLVAGTVLILVVTSFGSPPPTEIVSSQKWLHVVEARNVVVVVGALLVAATIGIAPLTAGAGQRARWTRATYFALVVAFILYALVPAIWRIVMA